MLKADEAEEADHRTSKTVEIEETNNNNNKTSHSEHSPPPAVPHDHRSTTASTPQKAAINSSGGNKKKSSQTNPFHMHSKISVIPENRKGELNTQYLVTLPGVLKLAEVVGFVCLLGFGAGLLPILGFVSFILAICADRRSTSAAWTEHISFETTIVVIILLIGYVIFPHLTILNEKTRDGLVVVELLFYGTNTLFYFIGIWLMVHLSASWTAEGRGAAIMDAILCVALCVLYSVETFLKFKLWHGDGSAHHGDKRVHPTIPPPPTQRHGSDQHISELNREHSVV